MVHKNYHTIRNIFIDIIFPESHLWCRNLLAGFEKATQNITKNKNATSWGDFTVYYFQRPNKEDWMAANGVHE